jgi:hypothetical protein
VRGVLAAAVAHSRGSDCDSLLRDFTGWAAFVVKRVSSDKSPYSFNNKLIHFGLRFDSLLRVDY